MAATSLAKPYQFEKLTLAFEVDLQLVEKLDVDESIAKQLNTTIASQIKASQHVVVKHLVLNLASELTGCLSGSGPVLTYKFRRREVYLRPVRRLQPRNRS